MKRLFATLVILASALALSAPLAAQTATWNSDPVHSAAWFTVRHLMVSNVRGEFTKWSATIVGDPKEPTKATIEATFDTASLTTGNEQRDGDVKGPNFLDVGKYPAMTFKSRKIENAGPGKLKVTGDLSIHGVTKEVALDVEGPTPVVSFHGAVKTGASARTKISRKDFGVAYNRTLDSGGAVVGDEIAITLELELNKRIDTLSAPAPPTK